MENQIRQLKISNFKSIREAELDCGRINLFVGKPNVGKSNLLEAVSLLGAAYGKENKFLSNLIRYEDFSHLFFDQETDKMLTVETDIGAAVIKYHYLQDEFEFILGPSKDVFLQLENPIDKRDFAMKSNEAIVGIPSSYAFINNDGILGENKLSLYSPVKKYLFTQFNEINKRQRSFLLPPSGKNLLPLLLSNETLRNQVENLFEEYQLKLIFDSQKGTIEILKELSKTSYKRLPFSLLADTLQRIIFHYAAIFSNKDSVILFEEPESHSFPPYVSDLAYKIVEDKENQYFITTHSPHLFTRIVEETPVEEVAVFIVYFENYETKFKKLTAEDISELLNYGIDIFFNAKYFLNEQVSENPS